MKNVMPRNSCICTEDADTITNTEICVRYLHLSRNKRDRTETLTKCAEWPQFAVDYFLLI